jgi:hypothetical protein
MKSVYETFFFLKYRGGWSFIEAYSLPVKLRDWFTKRLLKQLEDEHEAAKKAAKKARSRSSKTRRG